MTSCVLHVTVAAICGIIRGVNTAYLTAGKEDF